ncbi:MAG: hypothetical protein R3A52_23970 [Polyangiales bacterium]
MLLGLRDVGEVRVVGVSLVDGYRGPRKEPSRLLEVIDSEDTPSGVTLFEACSFTAQWATLVEVRSEPAKVKPDGSVVFDRCVWNPTSAESEITEGLRVADVIRSVTVRRSRLSGAVTSMIVLQRGELVVDASRIVALRYGPPIARPR